MSGLLAVLLLSILMSSVITMSLAIHSRIIESSKKASMDIAKSLSDTLNAPVLSSVVENGELIIEIYAVKPTRVTSLIAVFENSTTRIIPIEREVSGIQRVSVVKNYRCEKMKLAVVLENGQVVMWNPERDPRIKGIPRDWDGWFKCFTDYEAQSRQPQSIIKTDGSMVTRRDPITGFQVIEVEPPIARAGEVLRPSYSKSIELQVSSTSIRFRELPQGSWIGSGSFSVEIDRIRHGSHVITLSAHARMETVEQDVVIQTVWLMLNVNQHAIFRGRIEVVLPQSSHSNTGYLAPTRTFEYQTILVLAYSPGGSQHFETTCRYNFTTRILTVEGRASGVYETPGPIVILYNAFDKITGALSMRINITIDEVVIFDIQPRVVRINGVEAISSRHMMLDYISPINKDYITTSIYGVFRDTMTTLLSPVLKICSSDSHCSSLTIGKNWVHAWSPTDVFELELRPRIGPALRAWDRGEQCLRYQSGTCVHWRIWGSSSTRPLPAPWTMPYVVEIRIGGENYLITSPPHTGMLYVQNPPYRPQRGYAMVIADMPLHTSQQIWWVRGEVDWNSLTIFVESSLWSQLNSSIPGRQSHYVGSSWTMPGSESVIVWVS